MSSETKQKQIPVNKNTYLSLEKQNKNRIKYSVNFPLNVIKDLEKIVQTDVKNVNLDYNTKQIVNKMKLLKQKLMTCEVEERKYKMHMKT